MRIYCLSYGQMDRKKERKDILATIRENLQRLQINLSLVCYLTQKNYLWLHTKLQGKQSSLTTISQFNNHQQPNSAFDVVDTFFFIVAGKRQWPVALRAGKNSKLFNKYSTSNEEGVLASKKRARFRGKSTKIATEHLCFVFYVLARKHSIDGNTQCNDLGIYFLQEVCKSEGSLNWSNLEHSNSSRETSSLHWVWCCIGRYWWNYRPQYPP